MAVMAMMPMVAITQVQINAGSAVAIVVAATARHAIAIALMTVRPLTAAAAVIAVNLLYSRRGILRLRRERCCVGAQRSRSEKRGSNCRDG